MQRWSLKETGSHLQLLTRRVELKERKLMFGDESLKEALEDSLFSVLIQTAQTFHPFGCMNVCID